MREFGHPKLSSKGHDFNKNPEFKNIKKGGKCSFFLLEMENMYHKRMIDFNV
jgi:hypothetical protein